MQSIARPFAGALVVVALGGCSSEASVSPLGAATSAIVGGRLDTTHQAVMYLQYQRPGSHMGVACTGTLVATDGTFGYLLTAAHCVVGESDAPIHGTPSEFSVAQGNDAAHPDVVYRVVDFRADPLYDDTDPQHGIVYDFAVVKFTGVGPSTPKPIPMLDAAHDDLAAGTPVEIVGYGIPGPGQRPTGKRMTVGNRLADVGGYVAAVSPLTIGYPEGAGIGGACNGDSGGPVFATKDGIEYVAGVTSYGDRDCREFGVSGRVSAVVDQFVRPYMNGGSAAKPTCGQCQEAATSGSGACRKAVDVCVADPECLALAQCLVGCDGDDVACLDGCVKGHPKGEPTFVAVGACTCTTACASECAGDASCAGAPEAGASPEKRAERRALAVGVVREL